MNATFQHLQAHKPLKVPPTTGDDYFSEKSNYYIGRSQKGTGEEGKGQIRVIPLGQALARPKIKVGGYEYVDASQIQTHSTLLADLVFDPTQTRVGTHWQTLHFITTHYAKQLGITAPITVRNNTELNGIMFTGRDEGIAVNVQTKDGCIHKTLNYISNFRSCLVHENFHWQDFAENLDDDAVSTHTKHIQVYLKQIQHQTFLETPKTFRNGISGSYLDYVKLANREENPSGDYDKIAKWINDFNALYSRTGYKIYAEYSAGGIIFSYSTRHFF